jgi:hypothetical protein
VSTIWRGPVEYSNTDGTKLSLTAQGATECAEGLLDQEGGVGLGPCLEQLGFFGYKLQDDLSDWSCGDSRMDVSTCMGLQCNDVYQATEVSTNTYAGNVYYECVKQISYNDIILNAPSTYFYVPAGCEYNTDWDPKYPCFGGMQWTAIGSPCPTTCHYTPTEEHCSSYLVPRCICPDEKPIWDRLLGCSTRDECNIIYGDIVDNVQDEYQPVRQAEPFPFNWDGT